MMSSFGSFAKFVVDSGGGMAGAKYFYGAVGRLTQLDIRGNVANVRTTTPAGVRKMPTRCLHSNAQV